VSSMYDNSVFGAVEGIADCALSRFSKISLPARSRQYRIRRRHRRTQPQRRNRADSACERGIVGIGHWSGVMNHWF
jgi:hypothetical protein